ncbi:MAG: hypothetical protein JWM99_3316, partial [Verrucomicrobiales bacterium]|nr:hypothetical protein [Verrucomicrobiales bacterium]
MNVTVAKPPIGIVPENICLD